MLAVHGGVSGLGGWGVLLLIASVWGILIGMFAWIVQRLAGHSIALACIGAPFVWVTLEFVRARLPEISFPWNLLGYPAAANLGTHSTDEYHGNLWAFVFSGGIQCLAGVGGSRAGGDGEAKVGQYLLRQRFAL